MAGRRAVEGRVVGRGLVQKLYVVRGERRGESRLIATRRDEHGPESESQARVAEHRRYLEKRFAASRLVLTRLELRKELDASRGSRRWKQGPESQVCRTAPRSSPISPLSLT
jgi:hypothetical protein